MGVVIDFYEWKLARRTGKGRNPVTRRARIGHRDCKGPANSDELRRQLLMSLLE